MSTENAVRKIIPIRQVEPAREAPPARGGLEALVAEQIADHATTRIVAEVMRLLTAELRVPQMLFTVPQAAIYLGRTTKALQHMIADGKLPLVRDGRKVQLHRADLDRWIEENKY